MANGYRVAVRTNAPWGPGAAGRWRLLENVDGMVLSVVAGEVVWAAAAGGVTSVNGDVGPVVVLDADDVAATGTRLWLSSAQSTKLAGIETGADVTDAGNVTAAGAAMLSAGGTFALDVSVPDEVYGAGWDGSVEVPTKNALYDKIETLGGGSGLTHPQVLARGLGA